MSVNKTDLAYEVLLVLGPDAKTADVIASVLSKNGITISPDTVRAAKKRAAEENAEQDAHDQADEERHDERSESQDFPGEFDDNAEDIGTDADDAWTEQAHSETDEAEVEAVFNQESGEYEVDGEQISEGGVLPDEDEPEAIGEVLTIVEDGVPVGGAEPDYDAKQDVYEDSLADEPTAEEPTKTEETPKPKREKTGYASTHPTGTVSDKTQRCGAAAKSGVCIRPLGHGHGHMSQVVLDKKTTNAKAKRDAAKAERDAAKAPADAK